MNCYFPDQPKGVILSDNTVEPDMGKKYPPHELKEFRVVLSDNNMQPDMGKNYPPDELKKFRAVQADNTVEPDMGKNYPPDELKKFRLYYRTTLWNLTWVKNTHQTN